MIKLLTFLLHQQRIDCVCTLPRRLLRLDNTTADNACHTCHRIRMQIEGSARLHDGSR